MDTLLKADIFFFITSVVVTALAILGVAILIYVVQIMRDVKHISGRVREETDAVAYDISQLRVKIREEGMKWKHFSEFFGIGKKKGRKGRKRTNN